MTVTRAAALLAVLAGCGSEVEPAEAPPAEVLVPAGDFVMGCNAAKDSECQDDERPAHRVTVSAFIIGTREVTVAEYARCVAIGACTPPHDDDLCNYGAPGKDGEPVGCVDWFQAKAYCEAMVPGGRLPTEAEWEKAARGGCELRPGLDCAAGMPTYPWGDGAPTCERATYSDGGSCGGGPTAAGAKPAGRGPYGALDMAGNLWEWVADWYDPSYYATADASAPDPAGPAAGAARVVRGSCFGYPAVYLRASNRSSFDPGLGKTDGEAAASALFGFRCVRTP